MPHNHVFSMHASSAAHSFSRLASRAKLGRRMLSPKFSDFFPLHVIGAGSIGLLFASRIQGVYEQSQTYIEKTTQPPVTLLMRPRHRSYLVCDNSHSPTNSKCQRLLAPVTIISKSDRKRKMSIPVEIIGPASEQMPSIRSLLLCTKANHACAALASIWSRLEESSSESPSRIIILSNGALAIKDSISKSSLGHNLDIIHASTTHGAYKDRNGADPYCIHHVGDGLTHCTDEEFVGLCQEIGWKSFVLSEFEMNVMLWKKLAANCVINPLTAIYGVKNGEVVRLQHGGENIRLTITFLLEEVSQVALKEIESIHSQISNENDGLIKSARQELSVASLQAFVDKVISDTANNISSMLQDVEAKRETEIQFLNGYVSRVGREKYGIDCPHNSSLCSAVEELFWKHCEKVKIV